MFILLDVRFPNVKPHTVEQASFWKMCFTVMSDSCVVDPGASGPAPPECGSSQRQRAVGEGAQDRGSETCGHGHLEDTNLIIGDNHIHIHTQRQNTLHTSNSSLPVCLYNTPSSRPKPHSIVPLKPAFVSFNIYPWTYKWQSHKEWWYHLYRQFRGRVR